MANYLIEWRRRDRRFPRRRKSVGGDDRRPQRHQCPYRDLGGNDASRFTIDSQTGVLTFVNAPNFEAAGDFTGNNVYDLTVTASDGSGTDSQAIAVTVTNVNEPFTITNSTATQYESSLPSFMIATDEQDSGALVFTIVGGADAAKFKIVSTWSNFGAFSFVNLPNYEAPTDSNGDNVYELILQARTAPTATNPGLTVTVMDAQENVFITRQGVSSAFLTRGRTRPR